MIDRDLFLFFLNEIIVPSQKNVHFEFKSEFVLSKDNEFYSSTNQLLNLINKLV